MKTKEDTLALLTSTLIDIEDQYNCLEERDELAWCVRDSDNWESIAASLREIKTYILDNRAKSVISTDPLAAYLEYRNDYLTLAVFAEHKGLTLEFASNLVNLGRTIFHKEHKELY